MKKLFLGALWSFFLSAAFCQTIFTYGDHSVSKDEFLRAYNKNKTPGDNKQQALKEYLDLYIKFKLKVQAARDMSLDTVPSLIGDLQNFRTQIENNYLQDDKEVNALVKEAFQRSQHDIHVQHFFVSINDKMAPADTIKLVAAINEAYDELKKGGHNYYDMVSEIKEKIAPLQGNDLGWITVFTLPYEFENLIYALKPGEVTQPYRSKKGWHIFKDEEERPAVGRTQVAQILFAVPSGNIDMRDRAKRQADSVYHALKAGADFGQLAKQYSDDRRTYMNGGLMPEFGIASYDGAFEQAAFSLEKDSDISAPFQTEFGYHILKRISRTPVPGDMSSETYMAALRQKVIIDSRNNLAKEIFLKSVLKKIGYRKNNSVDENDLWTVTDTFAITNKKIASGKVNEQTILFSFNNQTVKVGDWVQYVRNVRKTYAAHATLTHNEQYKNYLALCALENYKKRLEDFNEDFKYQLQEFREGNMLFEVMQRNVWTKASSDSAGLEKYYTDHLDNYKWNASADAILFSCADATVAAEALSQCKKGKAWKDIIKDNAKVQADSGRYEVTQIPVNGAPNFAAGMITSPVVNKGDGTAVFTYILKTYPPGQQRNFPDARGLVINDYQSFLEQKWVAELTKKYPVSVNEKVLNSIRP